MCEGSAGTEKRGNLGPSSRSGEEEVPESSRKQIHSQVKQTEQGLCVVCYSSESLETARVREKKQEKFTLQKICVCVAEF